MYQLLWCYTDDSYVYEGGAITWQQLLYELDWRGWQERLKLTNWEMWVRKVE